MLSLKESLGRKEWQEFALCKGSPIDFYSDRAQPIDPYGGKYRNRTDTEDVIAQTCRACPVRIRCIEEALRNREKFGVWGGLTITQLKRVRTRLRNGGTLTQEVLEELALW